MIPPDEVVAPPELETAEEAKAVVAKEPAPVRPNGRDERQRNDVDDDVPEMPPIDAQSGYSHPSPRPRSGHDRPGPRFDEAPPPLPAA